MATKVKTSFFCQNCGASSPKWIGKCPSCQQWNTYVEEVVSKPDSKNNFSLATPVTLPSLIHEIEISEHVRINTTNNELNRVLGGGLVAGSITLIGGEPGIGKSTLMLQIALKLQTLKILYISGEESIQQIKMRADRLGIKNTTCYILNETNTQQIFAQIEQLQPDLLIVDSIQTVYSDHIEAAAGSVSQIRQCAAELQKFAKHTQKPVILVGHITKDGTLAGPKVLEHMVDTVLYFEGDRNHIYRILRASKNRFGSTSEIGIFEMQNTGMREVPNPSEILLSTRDEALSGIAISCTLEGMRPLLVESQALVSTAVYGVPQRITTGFDTKRLSLLLAVLEKRCGFKLGTKDVFLNITGGIKIDDPAIDLGVICAILSSGEDIPISAKICFAGEVGLSGEIRAVTRIEQRIMEADKLGFNQIIVSAYNMKGINKQLYQIEIIPVKKIEDVFRYLFG